MEERTNIIWIVCAVGLFLILVLVFGLFLLNKNGSDPDSPLAIGPSASPAILYPDEWDSSQSPSAAPLATGPLGLDDQIPVTSMPQGVITTTPTADGLSFTVVDASPPPSAAPRASPIQPPPSPKALAASPKPASPRPRASAKPAAPASPKPVYVSEYWIQAASYKSRGKADDLRTLLATKGLASVITTKDVDGVTMYRVRLGPYSTEREASGWLPGIKALEGCSEAYVSKVTVLR